MRKGLFVTGASISGAPKVLQLLLQQNLKERKFLCDLIVLRDNQTVERLRSLSDRLWIWRTRYSFRSLILKLDYKGVKHRLEMDSLFKRVKSGEYDFIYGNTARCSPVINKLIGLNPHIRVIQHIHELPFMISRYCYPIEFEKSVLKTDHFIAVSKIVRQNLIESYSINNENISLIYEFSINQKTDFRVNRHEFFGINEDAFLILGSGTPDLRKGLDLFIQVAAKVLRMKQDLSFHFAWVGTHGETELEDIVKVDVEKTGIQDDVTLVPVVDNIQPYLDCCDVFLMTSREDPFPLVCIEAAASGKPIICFKDAVGSEEFIDDSVGGCVDYLDVEGMARRITEIAMSGEIIDFCKSEMPRRISHFTVEHGYNKITKIINA